jgi:hypothetical protein
MTFSIIPLLSYFLFFPYTFNLSPEIKNPNLQKEAGNHFFDIRPNLTLGGFNTTWDLKFGRFPDLRASDLLVEPSHPALGGAVA